MLDLCAAPGGKTLTLAMQMADHGEVVACDVSAERLARVTANVVRLGLRCVRTCVVSQTAAENLGTFDRAIADVPCTNTGVIALRPEARLGRLDAKLAGLIPLQRAILVRAASQVRPGGGLVYSTCSLEPEENEQQVAWFLAAHPAWRLDGQVTTLPGWGPRLADWRDGGYAARLLRRGAD